MSDDGDRPTDPDSLPAMAEAIREIRKDARVAADYSMRAYHLASSRSTVAWLALAVALVALACAGLR